MVDHYAQLETTRNKISCFAMVRAQRWHHEADRRLPTLARLRVGRRVVGMRRFKWRWLFRSVLAFPTLIACSASQLPPAGLISGSDAARIVLGHDDVLVVDAGPPAMYQQRRVRGAVHADYGLWLDRTDRDPRADDFLDLWRADLAAEHIGPHTSIVIYGRPGSYSAPATTWYGYQGVGIERVWVVSGGFEAIEAALPSAWIDRTPLEEMEITHQRRPRGVFQPRRVAAMCLTATKSDVLAAVGDGRTWLLDNRRETEFTGEETRGNPRPGRLPGAVHLEHHRVVAEDGSIRPAKEIRQMMKELGIAADEPVIVYCQSGGRSASVALALVGAGFTNVRNYFGSFREWSADEACPIDGPGH